MIIPMYRPHPLLVLGNTYEGKDISTETYCCTFLTDIDGENYARYITPNGWSRIVHYFPTRKDAEQAFDKMGQSYLPFITNAEIANREDEKEYWRQCREDSFNELVSLVHED